MLKVVLDTNIVVSALLTSQGLSALIFDLTMSHAQAGSYFSRSILLVCANRPASSLHK